MFFRFILLSLITFFIIRAIRSHLLGGVVRKKDHPTDRDLGVDPETIRDAEFTEVSDQEDGK